MQLVKINDVNLVFDLDRAELFKSKILNSTQQMLCVTDDDNMVWVWNLHTTYVKLTKEAAATWFLDNNYVTEYSKDMFNAIPWDLRTFASKCFLRSVIDEDKGQY